jgi:hypothetical protein
MSIRRPVACSCRAQFRRQISVGLTMTSAVPPDGPLCIPTQALRARLLSTCPCGDKSHSPTEAPHNYLNAYEGLPWVRARIREITSPARFPSRMIRQIASRASRRLGDSAASHRRLALAFVNMPANGWLTSSAMDAASSPMVAIDHEQRYRCRTESGSGRD